MTKDKIEIARLSIRDAFEAETTRRDAARREREDAERRQQEEDLARAEELEGALKADGDFLAQRELTLDRRRYTVSLDHADFRIAAYFEAGRANVTSADKRTAHPGATAPRKQQYAESVAEALRIMAQYLADETA